MGVVAAGVAVGVAVARGAAVVPLDVVACGAAGASITAAVRALVGDSPASIAGAVLAPLLAIATLFDPALAVTARGFIAIAALGWTVVELARPTTAPLVAVLPACVAAILDPGLAALVPIAGARLITAPWQRPRWAIAVPIMGGLVAALAVLACLARSGPLAALGDRWCGLVAHPTTLRLLAADTAATLGPMTAVAALAGLAVLARPRHAELATLVAGLGAALVALRTGAIGPSLVAVAALSAGLAVGRFAGAIRIASGQAVVGATTAVLLLLPPAWTAFAADRVSIADASR